MNSVHDDTLAANRQNDREDNVMGQSGNTIDISLTATEHDDSVRISGPSGPFSLPKDGGTCIFNFTLADETNGLDVQFESLDREDDCAVCPPKAGDHSDQIVGVVIHPPKKTTARFTDKNDNTAKDGPMPLNVSFQWNFKCNDPNKTVESYDPIILNGGKT